MDANSNVSNNIIVGIRIRPLNQKEQSLGEFWVYDDESISQMSPSGKVVSGASYTFGKQLQYILPF